MDNLKTIALQIEGLNCASCVGRAEKALNAVDGVASATVNLATETAQISYDAPADTQTLIAALSDAGYPAATQEVTLEIEGMSCASCVGRVDKAIAGSDGVVDVSVNLATETATVRFATKATTVGAIMAVATGAGYPAKLKPDEQSDVDNKTARKAEEINRLGWLTLIAALLALPVFAAEMGGHFIPGVRDWVNSTIGAQNSRLMQFVLTTLVLFGPGLR
ncbi:MAG: copper ion binding protein, partial [Marinosulfonomonas sp.]|nr:copper ion binding protein [Marinosulfonomonas sp.]